MMIYRAPDASFIARGFKRKHVKLKIVNMHNDPIFYDGIMVRLKQMKLQFDDVNPTLTIYLADKLNAIRDAARITLKLRVKHRL